MPDIFLSYNREDQAVARRFAEAFAAAGFDVWWDTTLQPGEEYDLVTENALKSAKAVVVLWSPRSVVSRWVRAEATLASRNKTLIPVMIEPCERPVMFELHQTADLSGWNGSVKDPAWRAFLDSLKRFTEGNPPSTSVSDEATLQPYPRKGISRLLRLKAKWLAVVPFVLAAFAAVLLWPGHGLLTTAPAHASNIAILPFKALTPDRQVQAYADGLADQLQSVLNANEMQTISSTDAEALRGPGRAQAIERLGVRLVFDGTVRQMGTSLDVRVHLDDAGHGVTLWTAELTGPLAEPDSLEGQTGARIIAVTSCASRALRPKGGLSDRKALSLYLKACDDFETEAEGGDMQLIYGLLDAFRKLTATAPDFGPAHSALAKFLAWYIPNLPQDQAPQLRAEAEREAKRALEIDPKDADAFVALSILAPPPHFIATEGLLDKALEVDPQWPYANLFKGYFLIGVGRMKEGIPFVQRAQAANPLSLDATVAIPLAWVGRIAEADAEVSRMYRLWSHTSQMWYERLEVHSLDGRWKEYGAALDDTVARPKDLPRASVNLLRLVAEAERSRSASKIEAARKALIDPQSPFPFSRIMALSRLGLVDDAYALTSKMAPGDVGNMFAPETKAMRQDLRFMPLAARLGLVDYWQKTGKWPDFCSDPGLPYDCKVQAAKAIRGPKPLRKTPEPAAPG